MIPAAQHRIWSLFGPALVVWLLAMAWACEGATRSKANEPSSGAHQRTVSVAPLAAPSSEHAIATFAGGCFWCMEPPFEKVRGVQKVISGYTGGTEPKPSYREVSSWRTTHLEAVQIIYNPSEISYDTLLDLFWKQIDPTDAGGQFADRGNQYRSAIFVRNKKERKSAEDSLQRLKSLGIFSSPIVTQIRNAGPFYPAEEYHQDFYKRNPRQYREYRRGSGRDAFLLARWQSFRPPTKTRIAANTKPLHSESVRYDKPNEGVLRQRLTRVQYSVTQQGATEPPFRNEYWNEHRQGIYVDVVSGEPLFCSIDKFDSRTGWPSFVRPLKEENIRERVDRSILPARTEVRSTHGDSHLGHVFKDGPAPTGLRYCINSAALRFIPKSELKSQGYGEFLRLFSVD